MAHIDEHQEYALLQASDFVTIGDIVLCEDNPTWKGEPVIIKFVRIIPHTTTRKALQPTFWVDGSRAKKAQLTKVVFMIEVTFLCRLPMLVMWVVVLRR